MKKDKSDKRSGKKKIVFIIDALSGGAGRVVYDIVDNIDRNRFEPVVISIYSGGGLVEDFKKLDIKMIYLDKGKGIGLKTILRLRDIMISEKADVVHTHNVDAYEYGVIAAKLAGVKNVIHTAHGKSVKRGAFRRLRENIFHRFVSYFLDIYAAVSADLARYAAENWCANKLKIRTVYNGIDYSKYKKNDHSRKFLKRYGIKEDDLLIGIVAGLRPVKNHAMLINAMKGVVGNFNDARLLIIGEGPMKKKLKKIVSEKWLEKNIKFLGNRTDIARLLNALDVNVLCSYSECLSMTLLEAMACEVPSIATAVGGNPELIDEETGFLVAKNDIESLAEKIMLLLKDEQLREKLGKNARKKVLDGFSIEKMIKRYTALYEE